MTATGDPEARTPAWLRRAILLLLGVAGMVVAFWLRLTATREEPST